MNCEKSLAVLLAVCEANNWSLAFQFPPSGGAYIVLGLPGGGTIKRGNTEKALADAIKVVSQRLTHQASTAQRTLSACDNHLALLREVS